MTSQPFSAGSGQRTLPRWVYIVIIQGAGYCACLPEVVVRGARASNVAWPPIFSVIQTIRRVSQEWELAGIEGDFHSKGEKESRPFDHDSSCAAEISACKKVNVGVEN